MDRTTSRLNSQKEEKPKNIIGREIRRIRLSQRPAVSQQALSARLETQRIILDQPAIARIELGQRGISDIEIIAIASALRVPVERLFKR